jgi:hypothetical protein
LIELAPQSIGSGGSSTRLTPFSGDPALVIPDFDNQFFASTDTNRIYRANGTTQGALIDLSYSPVPSLIVGSSYPYSPSFIGEQYYDQTTSMFFVGTQLAIFGFRPVFENMEVEIFIQNNTGLNLTYDLYYREDTPYFGNVFDELVASNLVAGVIISTRAIQTRGAGYYVIAPSNSSAPVVTRSTTGTLNQALGNRVIFTSIEIQGDFQNDGAMTTPTGFALGSSVAFFNEFPKYPLYNGDPYRFSFAVDPI